MFVRIQNEMIEHHNRTTTTKKTSTKFNSEYIYIKTKSTTNKNLKKIEETKTKKEKGAREEGYCKPEGSQ